MTRIWGKVGQKHAWLGFVVLRTWLIRLCTPGPIGSSSTTMQPGAGSFGRTPQPNTTWDRWSTVLGAKWIWLTHTTNPAQQPRHPPPQVLGAEDITTVAGPEEGFYGLEGGTMAPTQTGFPLCFHFCGASFGISPLAGFKDQLLVACLFAEFPFGGVMCQQGKMGSPD